MSDINDMNLNEETGVCWDPDAERPKAKGFAPVEDGTYQVTFSQGSRSGGGTEIKISQAGKEYLSAFVCATISKPGEKMDNRKAFFRPGTRGFKDPQGKLLPSDCHCIILSAGMTPPSKATFQEFASTLDLALSAQPTGEVYIRWEADVKNAEGKYVTILKGMKNFPQNADGTYDHILNAANTASISLLNGYTIPEGQEVQGRERVFVHEPKKQAAGQ